MQNVARLILGTADLTAVGLSTLCNDTGWAHYNSDFAKAYREYELLINAGLLSANILNELPSLYNRLKNGAAKVQLSSAQKTKLEEVLSESLAETTGDTAKTISILDDIELEKSLKDVHYLPGSKLPNL